MEDQIYNSNNSNFDDDDAKLYYQIEEYHNSQNKLKDLIIQNKSKVLDLCLISNEYLDAWKKYCLLDRYNFSHIHDNPKKWNNERKQLNINNFPNQLNNDEICIYNSGLLSLKTESNFHLITKEFFEQLSKNGNLKELKYTFKSINNKIIARIDENVIILVFHENKFHLFLLKLENFNIDEVYNYIEKSYMNTIFIENNCFKTKDGFMYIKNYSNNFSVYYFNKSYYEEFNQNKTIYGIKEFSRSTNLINRINLDTKIIYHNQLSSSLIQTNIVINNIYNPNLNQNNYIIIDNQNKNIDNKINDNQNWKIIDNNNIGLIQQIANQNNIISNNNIEYKPVRLKNTGDYSAINALLQCLSHCNELTQHLFNYNQIFKDNGEKFQLINAYINVLNNLFPLNQNYKNIYDPTIFRNTLFSLSLYSNNLSDLYNVILNRIQQELDNYGSFKEAFIRNNFQGKKEIFKKCNICNESSFLKKEKYLYISFPLEEAKKYTIECEPHNLSRNTKIFIEEIKKNSGIHIDFCLKNHRISYDDDVCKYCNNKTRNIIYPQFINNPNILCMIFNDNLNDTSNEVKVIFSETINIYTQENYNSIYELFGVISHLGKEKNFKKEHFIAFCKSRIDNKWYLFNDENVSTYSFNDILKIGIPFALFYHLKKSYNN